MDRIEDLVRFVREHEADNLDRLLLSASRYPGIDVHGGDEYIQGLGVPAGFLHLLVHLRDRDLSFALRLGEVQQIA